MDLEQQIIDLHKQYPNDMELGEQVRVLAWSLMKQENDPNQLTLFPNKEMDSMKR